MTSMSNSGGNSWNVIQDWTNFAGGLATESLPIDYSGYNELDLELFLNGSLAGADTLNTSLVLAFYTPITVKGFLGQKRRWNNATMSAVMLDGTLSAELIPTSQASSSKFFTRYKFHIAKNEDLASSLMEIEWGGGWGVVSTNGFGGAFVGLLQCAISDIDRLDVAVTGLTFHTTSKYRLRGRM